MTREEAIEYNKNLRLYMQITDKESEYKFLEENYVALDMAIKALEQEPCEDCISRKEVNVLVDELARAISDERCFISRGRSTAAILQDILDLLSVTPQQKIGHWSRKTKVDAYDIAGVKTWGIKCQCDKCDFTTIVVEDFGYYKYCPNCGARMIEP